MDNNYTAFLYQKGLIWIGWIVDKRGLNAQEKTVAYYDDLATVTVKKTKYVVYATIGFSKNRTFKRLVMVLDKLLKGEQDDGKTV